MHRTGLVEEKRRKTVKASKSHLGGCIVRVLKSSSQSCNIPPLCD